MNLYDSRILSAQEVVNLWDEICPLLADSCNGNELTETTLTPEHILGLVVVDKCALIGFFESGNLSLVMAFQFVEDNGHRAANILAFAGRDMMLFKRLYWEYISDWLAANGVEYIETLANKRMAKVFQNKFGFTQSSVCLRKPLKELHHG